MQNYEEVIRELLDDEHIKIKENELHCCCPFHNESRPSFGINLETGLFNCFSCKEKGKNTRKGHFLSVNLARKQSRGYICTSVCVCIKDGCII